MPLKIQYKDSVKVITIIDIMTTGRQFKGYMGAPNKRDASILNKLIGSEITKEYRSVPYSSIHKIPKYISCCFHQLIKNKIHIGINIQLMNMHFVQHNKKKNQYSYGYKKFKSIFMNGSVLMYSIFVQLMYNLEEMQVYNKINTRSGYKPSISLNQQFVAEIILSIEYINKIVGCVFNKWIIVEPKDSIEIFIAKHQSKFNQYQWNLKRAPFKHADSGNTSDNTLFIYRV